MIKVYLLIEVRNMKIEEVLLIIGLVILFILLLLIIVGALIGDAVCGRNKKAKPSKKLHNAVDEVRDYLDEGIANLRNKVTKEYDLVGTRGYKLHGYLVETNPNSKVYVLCIHGYRHTDGGFEFVCLLGKIGGGASVKSYGVGHFYGFVQHFRFLLCFKKNDSLPWGDPVGPSRGPFADT